jgi:hypothetical protein
MKHPMKKKTSALILTLLLLAGCSQANSDEAVRKALNDHLATMPGLDMSKMDLEINKVAMDGDKASTDVTFKVKGGASNQSMSMTYQLVRADGAWKVQGTPKGHAPEGGAGAASPHGGGAPPMGGDGSEKAGSSGGFHPDVSGGGGGMPPGHPAVNPPTGKQ